MASNRFGAMYWAEVYTRDLARAFEVLSGNPQQGGLLDTHGQIRIPHYENMKSRRLLSMMSGTSTCLTWYSIPCVRFRLIDPVIPSHTWGNAMSALREIPKFASYGTRDICRVTMTQGMVSISSGRNSNIVLPIENMPRPPYTLTYIEAIAPQLMQDIIVSRTELLQAIRFVSSHDKSGDPVVWITGASGIIAIDTFMPGVNQDGEPVSFSEHARAITGAFTGETNSFCVSASLLSGVIASLHDNQVRLRTGTVSPHARSTLDVGSVFDKANNLMVLGDDGMCETLIPVPVWVTGSGGLVWKRKY